MIGDGLQCVVKLLQPSRNFYANGETIRGSLELGVPHKSKVVSKITSLLICEEWVHTTRLEFKEHFHVNTKVFDVARNPIAIKPGHPATISFEIALPEDEELRLPPSFDLKHSNVVWKMKFSIEYRNHERTDIDVVEIAEPIRFCRYSEMMQPNLQDHSLNLHHRHATNNDFIVSNSIVNKGETVIEEVGERIKDHIHLRPHQHEQIRPKALKDLKDFELDLTLGVPSYGLIQTPREDGPTLGLQLTIEANHGGLELREIAIDLVVCVYLVGVDPYEEMKPVTRIREAYAVKNGPNDISFYLSRVRLSGFTEMFGTEWQQISQHLRITFSFVKEGDNPKHLVKLPWDVPVHVLSEAYGL